MGSVKAAWIKKYGESAGLKKWKNHNKGKGTLKWYTDKHGLELGKEKYLAKNKKLSVSVESLRLNGKSEEEILEIKSNHSSKSSHTIGNMISRHGEIEGKKRFKEYTAKNRISSSRTIDYWLIRTDGDLELAKKALSKQQTRGLDWFINKYGEEGKGKYIDCQRRKGLTKKDMISKYGKETAEAMCKSRGRSYDQLTEQFGIEKADSIIESRLTKFHGSSKIQKKFAQELYDVLDQSKISKFVGEPISSPYFIYLTDDERLILNQRVIIPDIVINDKFVLEFDGTYWHSLTKGTDKLKDIISESRGLTVIRIPEEVYKNNKEGVLSQIKKQIEYEN